MNPEELKVLEERITANPKSRSFLQLAEAYIEAGRKKEALELLKNGEEYYPYYLAARITYGKLLREEGETDRSIEQFEFVNRTIPDNLIALKNLASLYFEKSRLPEAKAMATSALALSPGDPEMTEIIEKVDAALGASAPPSAPSTPPQPEPAPHEEMAEPLPLEPESEPEPEPTTEAPSSPAPEETIVEMPHELFEAVAEKTDSKEPKQEAPMPPSGSELPQTETMGDLLVNQGHIEEALSVYEAVLAKDPDNKTVPEKLNSVRTMLRLIPPAGSTPSPAEPPIPEPVEEISAEPQEDSRPEPSPAPEPEPEPRPEPPAEEAPAPSPEPEMEEQESEIELPSPPAPASEPKASSPPLSLPEGVAGKIVEAVQRRMGRAFTGYVRASLDGLSVETSDSGLWGDILAAEGVEIVRAVSDMTRMLGWGGLQGTVVWMDRATLYGVPLGENEALFLALKPGANIGLCRLLVLRTIEEATQGQE
ncbi:MAG: tetratricopeptide repeat protein [Leptospirillia bacterium]